MDIWVQLIMFEENLGLLSKLYSEMWESKDRVWLDEGLKKLVIEGRRRYQEGYLLPLKQQPKPRRPARRQQQDH